MLGLLGVLLFPVACISESVSDKQKKAKYDQQQIESKACKIKNLYEYLLEKYNPDVARATADIVVYHLYPKLVTPSEQAQIDKYKVMGYM